MMKSGLPIIEPELKAPFAGDLLNRSGCAFVFRSIVETLGEENDLINWYEKALRGSYSDQLGEKLLYCLASEIAEDFPSVDNTPEIIKKRHYECISDPFWAK